MEVKQEKHTALQIAYQKVCLLGWTHTNLQRKYMLVRDTLLRIKRGKSVKSTTDCYYLSVFVKIIDAEYRRRIHKGGEGSTELLKWMREILLADLS